MKYQSVQDIMDTYEFQFGKLKDITGFYDERTTEIYVLSKEKQKIGEFFREILMDLWKNKKENS